MYSLTPAQTWAFIVIMYVIIFGALILLSQSKIIDYVIHIFNFFISSITDFISSKVNTFIQKHVFFTRIKNAYSYLLTKF